MIRRVLAAALLCTLTAVGASATMPDGPGRGAEPGHYRAPGIWLAAGRREVVRPPASAQPAQSAPAPRTLRICNRTGADIDMLYVSAPGSLVRGNDLLGADSPLAPDDSFEAAVPPGAAVEVVTVTAVTTEDAQYVLEVTLDPARGPMIDVDIEEGDLLNGG
jgi:hypothetical protein